MVWAILNDDIHAAVNEFIDSPSSRVVAVLGGGVVEEALLQSLALRLRQSSVQDTFFKPNGPMGGFASKIDLGYLLHMYDKTTRAALEGISEIRNIFAHRLRITSFEHEDTKLADAFNKKLRLHVGLMEFPHPFQQGGSGHRIKPPKSRRDIFLVNIQIVLALLMRDTRAHSPYSNESRLLATPPANAREPPHT